jgi:hypothetical protein
MPIPPFSKTKTIPPSTVIPVAPVAKAVPLSAAKTTPPGTVAVKSAPAPVPLAHPVAAAPESATSAASAVPKLKVAPQPPRKDGAKIPSMAGATAGSRPTAGAGLIGVGSRPAIKKPRRRRTPLIVTMNRCLAAAAAILVAFTGWEIWANIQRNNQENGGEFGVNFGMATNLPMVDEEGVASNVMNDAVELAQIQKVFEERPLFSMAGTKKVDGSTTTNIVTTVATQVDWEGYARKNLKLKGLSVMNSGEIEAIVSDSISGKLQYLKANDRIFVDRRNVKVEAVDKESVILSDGARRVLIK